MYILVSEFTVIAGGGWLIPFPKHAILYNIGQELNSLCFYGKA